MSQKSYIILHFNLICSYDKIQQSLILFNLIAFTQLLQDVKPGEHMVCQQYVSKPFLIDGFKFDLRVYVLVTSCDPLRLFVYDDGLGRFATMKYMDPSNNNLVSIKFFYNLMTAKILYV